jgi:uncharacterized protein YdhG (YjbR/CyaY superfamily)
MESKDKHLATIDEYIARQPENVQQILRTIRAAIKEAAPQVEEKISYNMPGFFLHGAALVWIGAFNRHIGLYPRTAGMKSIEGLSACKGTKGSVHFLLEKPIPYDLIREIVKVRMVENLKSS